MKRLVLIGEGHGEVAALPVLLAKLLGEKPGNLPLRLDWNIIRSSPTHLLRWDKQAQAPNASEWCKKLTLAYRRSNAGAVLAVFDGDFRTFPPGSPYQFCARDAARLLVASAKNVGAGEIFSLAIVFACSEYETWLIGSVESLSGCTLADGRTALPQGITFPPGNPESHGKRWLQTSCPDYKPSRDQGAFTKLLDPNHVRSKNIRSFQRLDHALDQLLLAASTGQHIASPA